MIKHSYSRNLNFEAVFNFRDLGGYQTQDGNQVAWRRLFRSGELHNMTSSDANRLKQELGLTSVLDLRSNVEIEKHGIGLVPESGFRYYNVSLISDGGDSKANERRYKNFTDMGGFYLHLLRQQEFVDLIIEALDVIAEPRNHPILLHCSAGKDRTGILTAVLLSIVGVKDQDIINDYSLSASYMDVLVNRMKSEPQMAEDAKSLPNYFWKAAPESMALFLSSLKKEYGSVKGYLKTMGATSSLFERLEKALLV